MKPNRFRSNRFFLVSLAAHDSTFMHQAEPTNRWQKVVFFIAIAPSFFLLGFPSFDLGKTFLREPSFRLPDTIKAGDILTIPAAEIEFPRISGRPLFETTTKEPMYYGVVGASSAPNLDLSFSYRGDGKWHPKRLLPKFANPQVAVFSKKIRVEADASQESTPDSSMKTSAKKPELSRESIESTVFSRTDGKAGMECWTEPQVAELENHQAKRRGRPQPKMMTVTGVGPGEVVFSSSSAAPVKSVVLYHGGGLYSRYDGLKEVRVRKDEKTRKNQPLGLMAVATREETVTPRWEVIWSQTEVNPQSLLALSSRLCGSK